MKKDKVKCPHNAKLIEVYDLLVCPICGEIIDEKFFLKNNDNEQGE